MKKYCLITFIFIASIICVAKADANLENRVSELNQLVNQQNVRISQLEKNKSTIKNRKFNPDIGLLADITAQKSDSKSDSEGNGKISIREIELMIGHDVDPFTRFDSTITFSDFEAVGIEEAYLTRWDLPFDLNLRLGRFRPKVGDASSKHRDLLLTVDEPLVVQEYFGLEGLFKTGLEISKYLPFSSDDWTSQIITGILEGGIGEGGTLFGSTKRIPTYYFHLKNTFDLNDKNYLEFSGTYLSGSSNEDSTHEVNGYGLNLAYTRYINSQSHFKFQSEFYSQNRNDAYLGTSGISHAGLETAHHDEDEHHEKSQIRNKVGTNAINYNPNPFGYYFQPSYRISSQYEVGIRYDFVEPVNLITGKESEETTGLSMFATFFQSEFARWRFQYENIDFANGDQDDRFFLQAVVAIGVHKHANN